MVRKGAILIPLLLVGCASYTAQQIEGVNIVQDKSALTNCYSLGPLNFDSLALNPTDVMRAETKKRGGDTLLKQGLSTPEAFVCDPQKVAERKAFVASAEAVRITNRQDVVATCQFIKNVTADTEVVARAEAVKAGGNVFFVVSDTTRTETTKESGSRTAYTYEVRRLTGEVYACQETSVAHRP